MIFEVLHTANTFHASRYPKYTHFQHTSYCQLVFEKFWFVGRDLTDVLSFVSRRYLPQIL